jgi:hypothetical protein
MSGVSEIAILSRLLDASDTPLSPEGARSILALRFPEADLKRMSELAEKARAGTLTAEERDEADSYERAGHVVSVLKSKARKALKVAGESAGQA